MADRGALAASPLSDAACRSRMSEIGWLAVALAFSEMAPLDHSPNAKRGDERCNQRQQRHTHCRIFHCSLRKFPSGKRDVSQNYDRGERRVNTGLHALISKQFYKPILHFEVRKAMPAIGAIAAGLRLALALPRANVVDWAGSRH
jgi:hypothetical protein